MNRRSLFGAFAGLLATPVVAAAAKVLPAVTPGVSGTATPGELILDGTITSSKIAGSSITYETLSAASIHASKISVDDIFHREVTLTDFSMDTYGNRAISEDTLIVAHEIVT